MPYRYCDMDPTTLANAETAASGVPQNSPTPDPAAASSGLPNADTVGLSMHTWLLEKIKATSPSLYDTLSVPVLGSRNTVLDYLITTGQLRVSRDGVLEPLPGMVISAPPTPDLGPMPIPVNPPTDPPVIEPRPAPTQR